MKRTAAVAFTAALLLLAGCAQPPSYDEVQAEAVDVMQAIVAELPEVVEVEDRSEAPYGCSLNGGGLLAPRNDGTFFTGRWVAHPGDGFDGHEFLKGLPAALGDRWEVSDSVVEKSYLAVSMRAGEVLLDVWVRDVDGEPAVDILAISRCGTADPR